MVVYYTQQTSLPAELEFLDRSRKTGNQAMYRGINKLVSITIGLKRNNWIVAVYYSGRKAPSKIPTHKLTTTPFPSYGGLSANSTYFCERITKSQGLYDSTTKLATKSSLEKFRSKKRGLLGNKQSTAMKDLRTIGILSHLNGIQSTLTTGDPSHVYNLITTFRPRSPKWHTKKMQKSDKFMNSNIDQHVKHFC